MALYVSRDKLDTQEVTLSGLLRMCEDCKKFCLDKTERMIENRSRAPRGWEKEYLEIATQRRVEDFDACYDACTLLNRSCPAPSKVELFDLFQEQQQLQRQQQALVQQQQQGQKVPAPTVDEKKKSGWFGFGGGKKTADAPKPISESEVISAQEVSRCENAADRFSKLLFALAHKPSKVHFDAINPKTGEKMEGDKATVVPTPPDSAPKPRSNEPSPPPGRNEPKRTDSKAFNDEILRRWSTSRRERQNMEELGVIRTHEETQQIKQDIQKQKSKEESTGTLPKWEK